VTLELTTSEVGRCWWNTQASLGQIDHASRFARDLVVQETGYQMLKAKGIDLVAADSPDSFLSDTPTALLIRQILGAVAQFDKATLVNKLRGAGDRKSAAC
jgi:hypothetical protein